MENKTENIKPYEDCEHCEYKGNHCHVNDRFQRLGMCIKIGGYGN